MTPYIKKLRFIKEKILWGGGFRESVLIKLLIKHYQSRIYRDWALSPEQPHFFDKRADLFLTGFGNNVPGFYGFTRGFNVAELISNGDTLLDIGCGEGFFTKRFFSVKCSHIDAIDIEPSAIAAAIKYNNDTKIKYIISDAVKDPFPRNDYDIIVWDGAIGHFASETVEIMLKKIKSALKPTGIFVGSESLGQEGRDHLQFFETLESMSDLFKLYFKNVALKSIDYTIPVNDNRSEAYWKCANSPDRLTASDWKYF